MPSNARWLRDRESEMLTRDRHSESERGCVSVEESGCCCAAFESKHGCMRERGAAAMLCLRVRVVA